MHMAQRSEMTCLNEQGATGYFPCENVKKKKKYYTCKEDIT